MLSKKMVIPIKTRVDCDIRLEHIGFLQKCMNRQQATQRMTDQDPRWQRVKFRIDLGEKFLLEKFQEGISASARF
jgi:hypothetical protein